MNKQKQDIKQKFVAASFPVRTVAGAAYVTVLVGCIMGGPSFYFAFMLLVSIGCLREFLRMLLLRSRSLSITLAAIHLLVMLCLAFWMGYIPMGGFSEKFRALLIPVLFTLFLVELLRAKDNAVVDLGKTFLTFVYITMPFALALLLPYMGTPAYDFRLPLGIFVLTWVNDTFAYLVGISIGRHKLMERISPKKTMEGFLGGFLFTLAAGYLLWLLFPQTLGKASWIVVAAIVGIMGVAGDLVESMFKRMAGVKDSGQILPGHGGLLDRLDSFILSVPFIYTYLYLL